jgi:hypothetical protein
LFFLEADLSVDSDYFSEGVGQSSPSNLSADEQPTLQPSIVSDFLVPTGSQFEIAPSQHVVETHQSMEYTEEHPESFFLVTNFPRGIIMPS